MSTALTVPLAAEIEKVLIGGDLKALTADQRVQYYNQVCGSIGLNPLTRPFDYLNLNGKLVLYARKDCTDQLRALKGVSIYKVEQQETEGLYIVTAYASMKDGRQDADTGAVNIAALKGEARANAIMKATTKAKRRCTLSICGLGFLDETEAESIPGAYKVTEEEIGTQGSKDAQAEYLASKGLEPYVAPKRIGIDAARTPAEREASTHEATTVAANVKSPSTTTSPETIRELSDTLDQPPAIKTIEIRKAAQDAEAEEAMKGAEKPKRKKGKISFEALRKWGELKDELRKLTGTDTVYYSALKAKGYGHADEIATEADAAAIWKVLGMELNRLRERNEALGVLEHASEVIGVRAFSDLLGLHGCLTIDDALALSGDPWQALLAELKDCVDGKQVAQ